MSTKLCSRILKVSASKTQEKTGEYYERGLKEMGWKVVEFIRLAHDRVR